MKKHWGMAALAVLVCLCLVACAQQPVDTTDESTTALTTESTTQCTTQETQNSSAEETKTQETTTQSTTENTQEETTQTTEEAQDPTQETGSEAVPAMDYQRYNSLPGEEQMAFINSFPSIEDFFVWYNSAKAQYEAEHPDIEIGGDGNVDLSGK